MVLSFVVCLEELSVATGCINASSLLFGLLVVCFVLNLVVFGLHVACVFELDICGEQTLQLWQRPTAL